MFFCLKSKAALQRWLVVVVAFFFCAISGALFFPALFLGKLIYGYDTLVLCVPFHVEVMRSLAAFQWPLWMPDILGGMPGVAACNLWFVYPTDFVAYLAHWSLAFRLGFDAAFHVAVAGVGMFLFLRRLGRSFPAAALGSVFFAVSGSEISQLFGGYYSYVEGIAWTPWAFWAVDRAIHEKSWYAWGLCGGTFALQILAGAAQLFSYTFVAVVCFTLQETWNPTPTNGASRSIDKNPPRTNLRWACQGTVLALGLAFVLAAPQLWPTLQYLPLSTRHGYTHAQFVEGSIGLSETLSWFVPGFWGWKTPTYHGAMVDCFTSNYFGLLPWILAAGALVSRWRIDTKTRYMAFLALGAFFFAQGRWTPFYELFHHLPILAGFRIWYRTLFLLTFAICALAAAGWDALSTPETRATTLRWSCVFLGLTMVAAATAWALAPETAAACTTQVIRQCNPVPVCFEVTKELTFLARISAVRALELGVIVFPLLFLVAKRKHTGAALLAALAFHAFDQSDILDHFVFFTNPKSAAATPSFFQTPPSQAGLEPWRIIDVNPARPNNDVLLGYENLEGTDSVPLESYQRIREALKARPAEWANLMGERFLFVHRVPSATSVGTDVKIYRNPNAFPRAWLVGTSHNVTDDTAACRLLADPGFNPRVSVAVETDLGLAGPQPQGAVQWLARSPQSFTLSVSTDRAAALVVSNFWYPSWVAEIDGRKTPIFKADGGIQAIALPKGVHQVNFRFDPALFDDALAACLAGLVFLAGLGYIG